MTSKQLLPIDKIQSAAYFDLTVCSEFAKLETGASKTS